MTIRLPPHKIVPIAVATGKRGFSLVELLIAMVMAGVVMGAIYNIYVSQQKAYSSQELVAETQQNFRAAITVMGREIRLAGHRNPAIVSVDPSTMTDCILDGPGVCVGSNASQLVFTYFDTTATDTTVDYNGTGNHVAAGPPDPGDVVKVTYDLYDAYSAGVTDDLGRTVGAGNKVPTVLNIHGLEFRYLIDNGVGGFNIATSVDAGNMRSVRGVEVTILAKSSGTDRNYPVAPSFTSPGGTTWTLPTGIRGRMFTTTIMCRNLSL